MGGLGKVLGRFWEGFSMISVDFFREALNGVEGHETLRGRMNFEGRLLKKHANFAKNQQKIDANSR